METITIRELHAKTGHWVRRAADHGEIRVTDHGRTIAKILPTDQTASTPYFSRRINSRAFQRLEESGKLRGGQDATIGISEDREDRDL